MDDEELIRLSAEKQKKKKKTLHEMYLHTPNKVEERELTAFEYVSRAAGRSGYRCYCPFCDVEVFIFAWSGRKKCECGALLDAYVSKCLKERGHET